MEYGHNTYAPYSGTEFDLLSGKLLYEAAPMPVRKKAKSVASSVYARLLAAAKRLLEGVYKNEGLANKELAKFETQIQNLADKWDR